MREKVAICHCGVVHPEAVEAARAAIGDEDALLDLSDFFKVLGDSTRVRILTALSAGELCVCDLASLLSMTMSAISHQLRSLKQANLVRYRRAGKSVYYALSDDHVREILAMGLEHVRE